MNKQYINWNIYKTKHQIIIKDEFLTHDDFFKRFLEKHELKLLKKSEQKEYLIVKKKYIDCFEKEEIYDEVPQKIKTSKIAQFKKNRDRLLKLTIRAFDLGEKIKEHFTREDRFEDTHKLYEKYRPLLYETKAKEKSKKKMVETKKEGFSRKIFGKSDNLTGNISRLKKLYENGTLSKAEFEKAKNNLLK